MNPTPTIVAATLLASLAAAQGQALTIYNQNFAVVRDRIVLDLRQGQNDVQFVGVTTQLEPDSVVLRDPSGTVALAVLEQNYRADTISQGLLLSRYEGQQIDFLVIDRDGSERTVRGKILRSGYVPTFAANRRHGGESPLIEVDGRLRFSLPGLPLFPALTDDAILQPTLHWRLFADAATKVDAELSYVTAGLSWQASYNLIAPEHGDVMDIVGWVTIDNQSGKAFPEATIKLMAGDVNKIQPDDPTVFQLGALSRSMRESGAPAVTEKAFDEFHLYSLPLPTTLYDQQQKQVEFVRGIGVKTRTLYVYNGAAVGQYRGWNMETIRNQPDYGTQSNPKVWVMREFQNTKENGLGIPLPKGRTRFYRRDDADGRLEFTGENEIDHTPRDETVRIYTGDSFDVVGERKRTDFALNNGRDQMEEQFEIRVRNRKDTTIEVRIAERLYRWVNWNVIQKSHDFVQSDAQNIEFRVQVPPGGEQVVTYRVRYDWQ